MAESAKPHSGGNTKYIVGGVVLLLLAMGVFFFGLQKPAQAPAPEPPPPPPPAAERVNPMAKPELIIEETPDAGKPQEETANPDKPKRVIKEVRDEWDCAGDLARPALQSVIDANRAQIRSCYERRLKMNNVLAGDLKLRLRVAPNGSVTATAVSGSLRDNEVFSCVRNIASKWSFPPPQNGCAVVQVPFQFSPKTN
ncbi:MAG TPA: AgmX/PglI C-terminal domain-containing protein [Polyangiales bacterium]|nr:AgmX/PglI C-terminal domain-containing protein [Polyangiales bacterium]